MSAASFFSVDDGTLLVAVPSCAMFQGGVSREETGTGNGEIEYANGSAKRWVRFEARRLTITGVGPAPHGLWALDFTVDSWDVTITSFSNNGTTEAWTVVPARPQDNRNYNTGRTSWSITFRASAAET